MTRRLTPEEERLWRLAMRGTDPMRPQERRRATREDMSVAEFQRAGKPASASAPRGSTSKGPASKASAARAAAPRISPAKPVKPQAPPDLSNLDRRSSQKVRRGKIEVDGRIDLHGLTQAEAHGQLVRYLLSASGHGKRVVLVITGKGRKGRAGHVWEEAPRDYFDGRGEGVLKAQVPMWLRQSPLREHIFSVQEAHPRHGGGGALYVFLKRS